MRDESPWELRRSEPVRPDTDDLAFIRRTLDHAATFTAIPGRGLMAMGAVGIIAGFWSTIQPTPMEWFMIWLGAAVVATPVGLVAMHRKANGLAVPMWAGPGARFVLGLMPAFAAAGILTAVFFAQGLYSLVPGMWLLLYGAGVLTAGIRSIRLVRAIGGSFMALGIIAFLLPAPAAHWLLGFGFGGLHLVFGAVIAWRYGG